MKNKKRALIILSAIVVIVLIIFGTKAFLADKNRLTLAEKEWINANSNNNGFPEINVVNDTDVFGNAGSGVFFDFLKDFEDFHSIKVNPVTYNSGMSVDGLGLKMSEKISDDDVLFYIDHFVLVGLENEFIANNSDIKGSVGVFQADSGVVNRYMNTSGFNVVEYSTREEMYLDFAEKKTINYILVPRIAYIADVLSSDYSIVYHFSEMKNYYYLDTDDSIFSSVLQKFSVNWLKNNLDTALNSAELKVFNEHLGIQKKEMDAILANTYNYGFLNTNPYELLSGGAHGGIANMYMRSFVDFSGIDLKFSRYKNTKSLNRAVDKGDIDILFGYNNSHYSGIDSGLTIQYVVAHKKGIANMLSSIKGLVDQEVYVLADTLIEDHLKTISGIKVSTYQSEKELKKLISAEKIIVMDRYVFDYYEDTLLSNYVVCYFDDAKSNYSFRSNGSDVFNKLMQTYFKYLSPNEMISSGLNAHDLVVKSGTVAGTIAKFSLYIFGILAIIGLVLYRMTRKVKIVKRIKKEDKMRFIDQLTSLKNRNYLSENIDAWNKNTVYPQTAVVIDLNRIQEINDTLGYDDGDKQIKAAANVLIKTQLDNSDIIRTDGNEFLVYLIGYSDKQIASYLKKLVKEFKMLPYEYGAAIGYSMIVDELKTVEDAVNEAVEQMKIQKDNEV